MMNRREFLQSTVALAGVACVSPMVLANGGAHRIRDLYNPDGSFSELAMSLRGQRVSMDGFMAPPLKAESKFFVLTKMPMSVCPFCETEAEWPDDILAIYTRRVIRVLPFNVPMMTTGEFEIGAYRDPETGFLSMARLVNANYS